MPRVACAPLISASQFEVTPESGQPIAAPAVVHGSADSGHPASSRRLLSVMGRGQRGEGARQAVRGELARSTTVRHDGVSARRDEVLARHGYRTGPCAEGSPFRARTALHARGDTGTVTKTIEDSAGLVSIGQLAKAGGGQQPDHPVLRGTRDPARAAPVAGRHPEVPARVPRLHRDCARAQGPRLPARGDQAAGQAGAGPFGQRGPAGQRRRGWSRTGSRRWPGRSTCCAGCATRSAGPIGHGGP